MNFFTGLFLWGFLEVIILIGGKAQENANSQIPEGLRQCYNYTYKLDIKDNQLPHNMHSFIGILRKIEEHPVVKNMDLREISVALLHRFRQDGIEKSLSLINSAPDPDIIPYTPVGYQFYKFAEALKLIPGNALNFPNSSINFIEQCSLHSMISSSIETLEGVDSCRTFSDSYRIVKRSINKTDDLSSDVETLTSEELNKMKSYKDDIDVDNFEPKMHYPALPPNHPDNVEFFQKQSLPQCYLENGVIKSEWGSISGGPLIAGIAAALQLQNVRISNLIKKNTFAGMENLLNLEINNKWLATLAGDLSEVALHQGPRLQQFKLGINGHWNSSKYYFINDNNSAEFTLAEVRGNLDGLILANEMEYWYRRVPTMRLSQVFDMYYSDRGFFNSTIQPCNRKILFHSAAPNDTLSSEVYKASLVLGLTKLVDIFIGQAKIEQYSVKAVNEFYSFMSSSFSNDLACGNSGIKEFKRFNRLAMDLTIYLDSSWLFQSVQSILTTILENADINKYSSNFTLINAWTGNTIINSSNSILNFYQYNETQYRNELRGFDLLKILDSIQSRSIDKLNRAWEKHIGGERSDIVLIIPSLTASFSDDDKSKALDKLKYIHEQYPDVTILFLISGSKDRWLDLAADSNEDVIYINTASIREVSTPLINLVNRMKRVPRRLINAQCDANYIISGNSAEFVDYVEPYGVNFYRLHPNYFYKSDYEQNIPTVNVQGFNDGSITVCSSRDLLHINSTGNPSCTTINNNNVHSIRVTCTEASYIHACNPLYLSISVNSSNNVYCTDLEKCRYPDMVRYRISYENLVCTSGATTTYPIFFFTLFGLFCFSI